MATTQYIEAEFYKVTFYHNRTDERDTLYFANCGMDADDIEDVTRRVRKWIKDMGYDEIVDVIYSVDVICTSGTCIYPDDAHPFQIVES